MDIFFLIFSIVLLLLALGLLAYYFFIRESKEAPRGNKPIRGDGGPDTSMLVAMHTMYQNTDPEQAKKIAEELNRRGFKQIYHDNIDVSEWVLDDSSK